MNAWGRAAIASILCLCGLGIIAATYGFCEAIPEGGVAIRERLSSYWQSLSLTARNFSVGAVPGAWDAGLFLNASSLNELFNSINSVTIRYGGTGALSGTTVRVTSVHLVPRIGALDAELDLLASKAGLSLPLRLAATVTFQGITKSAPDVAPELTLRIEPTQISPNVGTSPFGWAQRGFWKELIPDLVVALSDPRTFEVRLQLPDQVTVPLGLQKQETVPVNGGNGSVSYTVTMQKGSVDQRLAYEGVVFTDKGIWLLARLDENATQLVAIEPPSFADLVELRKKVAALETHVSAQLAKAQVPIGAAELHIGKTLFLSVADKLHSLDPANRRVTFVTTGQSGYLAGRRQDLGILGNLGIQAVLLDNNSGRGDIEFDLGQASWNGTDFSVPVTATMEAEANIQLNIDVIASGVVRTSVRVVGSGSGSMTVTAKPALLNSGSQHIAAVSFGRTCSTVRADIKTDGVLKTDFGWTKVPSVGGRISSPVGPLPPVLALSRQLQFVRLSKQTIGVWSMTPPYPAATVTLEPVAFNETADGLDLAIKLSADPVQLNQDSPSLSDNINAAELKTHKESEALKAAAEDTIKQFSSMANCPGSSEFALLLGDLEFGRNNDLVRLLVLVGKLPEAALDEIKRLPGEVSSEKIKGWIDNPRDSFQRDELGRQVDRLQHETSPGKVQEWGSKPVDSFNRSTPGQILHDPIGAASKLFH